MFTAKIDRVNKSITVSRNDLIAAGQFGTPEFDQMKDITTPITIICCVSLTMKRSSSTYRRTCEVH